MIDRTSNNAEASTEEATYDAINAILDSAESALLGVAATHQLHGINIERWRWDQPEIVMSWSPSGALSNLGKNIRVFVAVSDSARLRCSVESNAWLDEHQTDESIIRHWDNFSDRARDIGDPERLTQLESRWLKQQIERAYERIADAGEFVLSHAVLISPAGRSLPLEAPLRIANGNISTDVRSTKG